MATGILGGTFNPVHTGHLRLAVEVGEAMGLERVLLSPGAHPPHKSARGILPFALRVALLQEALRGFPLLGLSTLEGEMRGPSYTFMIMEEWRRRHPAEGKPWFLLGAEDFAGLDSWRHGLDIPKLANLIVVPRAGADRELFRESARRFWPRAVGLFQAGPGGREEAELGDGGLLTFLPAPRLDISSSFVRRRWLDGPVRP